MPKQPRRQPTLPRKQSSPRRTAALLTIAVLVLATAAYFLWPVTTPSGPEPPQAATIQVSMGGFSPARIQAKVGQPLTLRLVNEDDQFHTDGGGWHQFAIDELGIDVNVPPLSEKEFTFTPTQSGTFGFYCGVCCGGRDNPNMWGELEVLG